MFSSLFFWYILVHFMVNIVNAAEEPTYSPTFSPSTIQAGATALVIIICIVVGVCVIALIVICSWRCCCPKATLCSCCSRTKNKELVAAEESSIECFEGLALCLPASEAPHIEAKAARSSR